ncbi:hypothetical protein LL033_05045 [Clostridium estertheticum]|uniref:hypothetical protein n=1 Tax=Clostridium estertheticum TaxID=238834 RepID=UPI00227C711E|nr:hypothetical protein [Clostridium estertheticum]WAG56614.1 hypothetical protein LL033_05045 [Clostridium estertheticum]
MTIFTKNATSKVARYLEEMNIVRNDIKNWVFFCDSMSYNVISAFIDESSYRQYR